jgi:hypothetical protein
LSNEPSLRRGTGAAFFGEFMRMHRDLLSDAARVYIQNTLFKSEPNKEGEK